MPECRDGWVHGNNGSGDGDPWNITFSGATNTKDVSKRKSSKKVSKVTPPKHQGYVLQHAFYHI